MSSAVRTYRAAESPAKVKELLDNSTLTPVPVSSRSIRRSYSRLRARAAHQVDHQRVTAPYVAERTRQLGPVGVLRGSPYR